MPAVWKRFLAAGALLLMLVLAACLPATVSAATDPLGVACQGAGSQSAACGGAGGEDPIAGPNGAIIRVTTILATIAGMVSVIFLVIGGFKYITSGGDSSGIASAKSTIIYALVGAVVALLAKPIVTFVVGRL